MPTPIRLVITGPPRTKKNSRQRLMVGTFLKDLPSPQYMAWLAEARKQFVRLLPALRREHPDLQFPLARPVSVAAIFYRDAERGDFNGYTQGLDDFLGDKELPESFRFLVDDEWVKNHDGTRLRKDAANPRVEVTVTFPDDEPWPPPAKTRKRESTA